MSDKLKVVAEEFRNEMINEALAHSDDAGWLKVIIGRVNNLSHDDLLLYKLNNVDSNGAAEYAIYQINDEVEKEQDLPF